MKWMKNEMIKAQVLLLLLVVFCGSTTYAQKQTSNSLLWEISGNGLQQPSFLFGTIHMICKEDFLLSETAKQKFNSSKQVYLELDMDEGLTGEVVKYGSEVLGHLDLLSVGLRSALIEALAREKGME